MTRYSLRMMMYYHGYAELFLDGAWVKATAVFDKTLCERVGIRPLEFDGRHDALFHPFDASGRQYMEYVRDHGASADVPVVDIIERASATIPVSSRWAPPVPSIASATRPSACRRRRDPGPEHRRARRALGGDSPAPRELIGGRRRLRDVSARAPREARA